ncbi:hypothetical protein GCM10025857_17040 [Alicyclobacillus contaminans]|nr:hypothetical protein GCM10025857_17040 [Alicyclobacillus contaminans]
MLNVGQEAYVHDVSTRKVDELVESLGVSGTSTQPTGETAKEQLGLVVTQLKN